MLHQIKIHWSRFVEFNKILKKFLTILIKVFPYEIIRGALPFESLSAREQFIMSDGYGNLLFSNFLLTHDDSVLVLGAYLGNSVQLWRKNYDCEVIALEPITTAAAFLEKFFEADPKVKILQYAASDQKGILTLGISMDATGIHAHQSASEDVETLDISEFIQSLEKVPKILEINIEGGEYAVLNRLYETKVLASIDTLLIQFHNYSLTTEFERAKLRLFLSKSHTLVYDFPWIWERWDARLE
jgi:FkbM family methyltransferase